jgi:hypothetical protein
LRPETSLSNLERALSGDSVSMRDMALKLWLDLTPLNNGFWLYWRKRVRPWAMESFEKTMETNDSVTELERIKAKRATSLQCKIVVCGGEKTQEVTRSTTEDEFRVNF